MKTLLSAVAVSVIPAVALAHADHSHDALTTGHILHSPFHIALIVAAVVGVAVVGRMVLRERRAARARQETSK
ncbi:hypothetical protein BFP70_15755 [Thioclava sp. SK-1]|uniref:hypothetical protein n=1 Tax=Thioclava sp. SK-1 TaxID=1889770 RepID=UPI000825DFFE|nr:hypothetical protein [Thioclava sp. SK-1]OCX60928.1 hypothetical protein BFP70_15755 [Thioclava sp. SK-1]